MAHKITIFEARFDGARLGPTFGNRGDEDKMEAPVLEESPDEAGQSPEPSQLRRVLPVVAGLATVSVLGALAARRFGPTLDGEEAVDELDSDPAEAEATVEPSAR